MVFDGVYKFIENSTGEDLLFDLKMTHQKKKHLSKMKIIWTY